MQVKCKKILANGGSDIFHVKRLLGEGVKKKNIYIYIYILKRERDLVWKLKESIYNSKILIFGSGIWCG